MVLLIFHVDNNALFSIKGFFRNLSSFIGVTPFSVFLLVCVFACLPSIRIFIRQITSETTGPIVVQFFMYHVDGKTLTKIWVIIPTDNLMT